MGKTLKNFTLTCIYFPQILCILPRDWHYVKKDSKMCSTKNLLEQYFLLLINFCTLHLERCSKFKFEAIKFFCVFVSQCKWVSGIDIYEAEIKTNTKIWEVFAKKNWIHKSSLLIILLIIILVRREDFCYKLGFKKPGKAILL